MKDAVAKRVIHWGESRIAVHFSYNEELAHKVREIPGSKRSSYKPQESGSSQESDSRYGFEIR
jgi:hypothetical protein